MILNEENMTEERFKVLHIIITAKLISIRENGNFFYDGLGDY